MRTLSLIAILLICTSCGTLSLLPKTADNQPTKKEIRHAKQAKKKLDKLVAKYPELKRTETNPTPISIKTPEKRGLIIKPLLIPGEKTIIKLPGTTFFTHPVEPGEVEPFDILFSDSLLEANFIYDGNNYMLDYNIKPMKVDTVVTVEYDIIQDTKYIPTGLTWWQKLFIRMGQILLVMVLLMALYIARRLTIP